LRPIKNLVALAVVIQVAVDTRQVNVKENLAVIRADRADADEPNVR